MRAQYRGLSDCQTWDGLRLFYEQAPKVRDNPNRRHLALAGARPTRKHWVERRVSMTGQGDAYSIGMWGTTLATFWQDGTVELNTGGYENKPLTREFLRAVLPRFADFMCAGNRGFLKAERNTITLSRDRGYYYPGKCDYAWQRLYEEAFLPSRGVPAPRVEFLFPPAVTVLFNGGVES